jgi:hypothetical protein
VTRAETSGYAPRGAAVDEKPRSVDTSVVRARRDAADHECRRHIGLSLA